MRAIDILFTEIDELNSKIKKENEMCDKLHLAFQIEEIIKIIKSLEKLRIQIGDEECI